MPRIDNALLECVIYLYPSKDAANNGEHAGGSGFIVSVASEVHDGWSYLYAVTCRHIVEDARSRTVRINTLDGGTDILPFELDHWRVHRDGHDIAACALPISELHKLGFVPNEIFVTDQVIKDWKIGPGDDALIVGRFINHEGKQFNTPSVRFGNISMMPYEAVRQKGGHMQPSFLVEAHSIGGYSGSPVFVQILPADRPFRRIDPALRGGRWLLGVDWGHIQDWHPLTRKSDSEARKDDWGIPYNSGMMGVVPAWQLQELLNDEAFIDTRKEMDAKHSKQQAGA